MKKYSQHDHGQDFGLLSLHYYFGMLCNEIGWHDLQIRQVSGNLQIVQCNMQIGRLADWTEHKYQNTGLRTNGYAYVRMCCTWVGVHVRACVRACVRVCVPMYFLKAPVLAVKFRISTTTPTLV